MNLIDKQSFDPDRAAFTGWGVDEALPRGNSSSERLSSQQNGRLLYELRQRWRKGTTHVAIDPLELIDRLAALVPPPRFHTVRYHGVLASRSKRHAEVVPQEARGSPPGSRYRPSP